MQNFSSSSLALAASCQPCWSLRPQPSSSFLKAALLLLQHGCHQSRIRCFGLHFSAEIHGWMSLFKKEETMTEKVKAALKVGGLLLLHFLLLYHKFSFLLKVTLTVRTILLRPSHKATHIKFHTPLTYLLQIYAWFRPKSCCLKSNIFNVRPLKNWMKRPNLTFWSCLANWKGNYKLKT